MVRFAVRQVMPHERDLPASATDHADQGLQGGGFASAVAPHEGNHLATAHLQVHVVQDLCRAIPGGQAFGFEQNV